MTALIVSQSHDELAVLQEVLANADITSMAFGSINECVQMLDGASLNNEANLVIVDQALMVDNDTEQARLIQWREANNNNEQPIDLWLLALHEPDPLIGSNKLACDWLERPMNKKRFADKVSQFKKRSSAQQQMRAEINRLQTINNKLTHEQSIAEQIAHNQRKNKASIETFTCFQDAEPGAYGSFIDCQVSPCGDVYVVLGNATSKGVATFVGAIPFFSFFHALVSKELPIATIALEFKKVFDHTVPENVTVALTLLQLNQACTQIDVWSAGMPDVLIVDNNGKIVKAIACQSPVITPQSSAGLALHSQTCLVAETYSVLLHTQGVIDALNLEGSKFGKHRLLESLAGISEQRLDRIVTRLNNFIGDHGSRGDIALAELKCQPLAPATDNVPAPHLGQHVPLPWKFEVFLSSEELKSVNPVARFIELICQDQTISHLSEALFTVLSELYSNALEHGLLQLDSSLKRSEQGFIEYYAERTNRLARLSAGWIRIDAARTSNLLVVTVADSGIGFDASKTNIAGDGDAWGRGILLIKSLARSVNYSKRGNRVEVELEI